MKDIDPQFKERLTKLITSLGFELVGYELIPRGRAAIFRLYIDRENGVTINDCSFVSEQVSALMDVLDPIQSRYTLEVSSPGVDRPLFNIEQYRKYVGSRVKIKLFAPINERKQYKGILKQVVGEDIYLLEDNLQQEVVLPLSMIEKGNIIGEVGFKHA